MSKLLDGNILCSPAPPAYYCDKAEGGEGVRGSNRLNPNIIESKGSEGFGMNERKTLNIRTLHMTVLYKHLLHRSPSMFSKTPQLVCVLDFIKD